MKLRVLVVGSGGREHALVWACKRSLQVEKVYCAPGNGGIAQDVECVDIAADAIDALLAFAVERAIDLVIVGPEQPLVLGIVDRFNAAGIKIWGPVAAASRLEGSKVFAKEFMQAHGIPTARFGRFTDTQAACAFLSEFKPPYVIKADGLAAGKGVVLAETRQEAEAAVREMLEARRFGSASAEIVIEEFLEGQEASFIVMCDGQHAVAFASSQDHKRLRDGDEGPNTGGMGAYSPAPIVTPEIEARVMKEVIHPVLRGMSEAGTPYRGFLYAGLMIDREGAPRVLEFNCRLGDPEAQALLFRLEVDLVDVILAALEGRLDEMRLQAAPGFSACVVLVAGGYPDTYAKGHVISGLPSETPSSKVFHAGTTLSHGQIVTSGGRVLGVTAKGATLQDALDLAYRTLVPISWEGMFYRRDIGKKGLDNS